jgi:hypothetical protein
MIMVTQSAIELFHALYAKGNVTTLVHPFGPEFRCDINGMRLDLEALQVPEEEIGYVCRIPSFQYLDSRTKQVETWGDTLVIPTKLGNILVRLRPLDGRPAIHVPVYLTGVVGIREGGMSDDEFCRLFGVTEEFGITRSNSIGIGVENVYYAVVQREKALAAAAG